MVDENVNNDETRLIASGVGTGADASASPAEETPVADGASIDEGTRIVRHVPRVGPDHLDDDTTAVPLTPSMPTEVYQSLSSGAMPQYDKNPRDKSYRRPIGGDAPGEGRSRSVGRAVMGAFLVMIAVVVIVACATYGAELWGGKTVPKVMGKSRTASVQALEAKGFKVTIEERLVDNAGDMAIETSPAAGTRVEEGSTVTLYIGISRTIPDVVGMALVDARAALEKRGAQNIEVTYEASSEKEGTVIAVAPEAGAAFAATDKIVLTIAQPFTVPDVVGQTEADALKAIENAGLSAKVTYVNSKATSGVVVSTSPARGSHIGKGETVQLSVSAPQPSDFHHLMEYLSASSRGISALLAEKGFAVQHASLADNKVRGLYTSPQNGTIIFSAAPFTSYFDTSSGDATDYLAKGTPFEGVRLELAESQIPTGTDKLTDAAMQSAIKLFGFSGLSETVTLKNTHLPAGVAAGSTDYLCAYGQMGENSWTILMTTRNGKPFVAASAGPHSLYSDYDLTPYGGSICSMVAYIEMYTG